MRRYSTLSSSTVVLHKHYRIAAASWLPACLDFITFSLSVFVLASRVSLSLSCGGRASGWRVLVYLILFRILCCVVFLWSGSVRVSIHFCCVSDVLYFQYQYFNNSVFYLHQSLTIFQQTSFQRHNLLRSWPAHCIFCDKECRARYPILPYAPRSPVTTYLYTKAREGGDASRSFAALFNLTCRPCRSCLLLLSSCML